MQRAFPACFYARHPARIARLAGRIHRVAIGKSVSQPAHAADGEKVIHHVDISWNQSWTGTDLVRFYKLDSNTLTITTAPAKNAFDGEEGQFILSVGKAQ